ncbi:MAG: hypothetical protein JWM44_2309 [Bacilli bacterium]|nr:hypothetical protein [Bacilli bacterium]
MELQEWFYNNNWAYYLYWILGIIFLIIIYKLPDVECDGKKWIIRLPSDGLGDAVESKQGLKTKFKGENQNGKFKSI